MGHPELIPVADVLRYRLPELPEGEKVAIRSAIRAVNAVKDASSAQEIETAAFKNPTLQAAGQNYLYESLAEAAKRAGLSDLSGVRGVELQKRYDTLFKQAAVEMREVLTVLVRTGRLPERGGLFSSLAATFMSDVAPQFSVELDSAGHSKIFLLLRFKSALGLIAYIILKLSEISAAEAALLICDECHEFKLIQSTGGDKISRFCSAKCRNRFNVRKWRAVQKAAAKHK